MNVYQKQFRRMIPRTRKCVPKYLFAHKITARIRIFVGVKIKIERVVDEIYGFCAANDEANGDTTTTGVE